MNKLFRKILKFGAIFLMMLVFMFSNLAPVALNKIGQQKLAENLEVKEALAAVPGYRGSGTFTAGTATIVPPYPASMQANDVCLLVVESENEAISLTTADGFVEVPTWSPQFAGTAITNPASRLALYWKRTVGGDTAPTVADAGNHTTGQIHCFSGVITTNNPWDTGAGGNDDGVDDTSGTIPGSTTTVDDTLVVLIISTSYNGNSTAQCSGWTNANLTSLTERADNTTTAGLGGGHCLATGIKATAEAYNTTTVTLAETSYKGAISLALKPVPPVTTISNFVSAEPSSSTIAPGESGQVDSFGLATDSGTDTVTAATVGLAAGMGGYIQTVAITNDGDTVTYCSAAPSGDSASLSFCGIPVSTTNTQFKIKITAISHASMPVPPGGSYAVTGTITSFTSTNSQSGSDSGSATVTIDNLSPASATAVSGSAGNKQVTLNWTTCSTDFCQSAVLRWASGSAGSEVPVEGSTYAVNSIIGAATVACWRNDVASTIITGVDGVGTSGCNTTLLTNGQAYTYKVFQRDSKKNYDEGVLIGTFTPAAPTATVTAASVGTQTAYLDSGATNQYVGAAFTFRQDSGSPDTITGITIEEVDGTATANTDLSAAFLRYEQPGSSTCTYDGTEASTGSVSFNFSEQAIFSGISIPVTVHATNVTCVYLVFTLSNGANYPKGGQTFEPRIPSSAYFILSGGSNKAGTYPLALAGTTTIRPNVIDVTDSALGDGNRNGETFVITGAGFGTDCVSVSAKIQETDLTCNSATNTTINATIPSGQTTTFGGTGTNGLLVTVGGTADDSRQTFYIYPNITSISGTPVADAQREASNINLNGTRFDTSANPGTITFTGGFGAVAATVVSWGDNLVTVTVPTAIADNVYLGDIRLTRAVATASKDDLAYDANAFRILPKIDSTAPVNLKGGRGDTGVSITGDHLCQDGSCAGSPEATEDITFNAVSGKIGSTWGHSSITAITVPATATDGPLVVTSDADAAGTFTSNSLTYDIKFAPTTPTNSSPTNGAIDQLKNPTITANTFSDGTDGDTHSDSQWQITRISGDYTAGNKVWEDTLSSAQVTIAVNNTNGTFTNTTLTTELNCETTYYWHVKYKDNGGVTSQEWSAYSPEFSFNTISCGIPDATSVTNNDEPGLTDGGRIGQTIVISGTSFGTVSADSRADCAGGLGTGCVKIGGTGGQTIVDARVTAWSNTSITIQLSLIDLNTTYGGATTNGIIVYGAGVADPGGLTFYIYPDITSLSVAEAREGDTITINGNKFGTGSSGGNVAILGAGATTGTWTETSISATVPETINDATDSGYVIVTQGTGSNNKPTNSTDSQASLGILPRITGISAASFSDGGFQDGTFTLNGSHFGAADGSISVNGQAQDGAPTWGVSAITSVGIPNNGTDSGSILLTRLDTKISNSWSFFYIYPQITGFTAVKGDGDIQTGTITISGNHFGASGTAANILINTAAPASIGAWGAGSITTVDIPNSGVDSGVIKVTNPQTTKQSNDSTAFYIYPQIISLTVPTAASDAAREYSVSDSDGLISINGDHFGASAGTLTILGVSAPTYASWGATLVSSLQVPTAIADNSYTGAIALTRSDTKLFSYAGFRILPRIISLDPDTGVVNDPIIIIGNHFCQSGAASCPTAFDTNNKITFNSGVDATAFNGWSNTAATTTVPTGASTGNAVLKSNGYDSNGINFTLVTPTPNDPASLGQFRNSGYTDSISVGGAASSTTIYFQMTMQALVAGGTLFPQIEVQPTGTAFTGTFTAEGTGQAGPGPTTGTTTVSTLTTNTKYHWQARVRHNKSGVDYYSNWVAASVDGEGKSFYIDATAPTLGSCPFHSSITSSGATISWVPSDAMSTTFTKQVQYSTDSSFTSSFCFPGSTCGTPTSGYTSGSQTVNLTGLGPNSIYYYRVRSKDEAGNEGIVGYGLSGDTACTFTTSKAETRTTEFYITTKTGVLIAGNTYSPTFNVYIPEPGYTIQSAFVELSGILDEDIDITAQIGVWVNSQTQVNYTAITSTLVNTPFSIIHEIPAINLNVSTPTNPNNTNTLNIIISAGDPTVSIVAAKAVVTYYHAPVQ